MELMKGFGWPAEEDLRNLMSAILRLQHVYNLDAAEVVWSRLNRRTFLHVSYRLVESVGNFISQIAKGNLHDIITNIGLRWRDCHSLGKHALATKSYALAVEWMELAIEKLKNESAPMRMIVENDLEHAILVVGWLQS